MLTSPSNDIDVEVVKRKLALHGSIFVTKISNKGGHGGRIHAACIVDREYCHDREPALMIHDLATIGNSKHKGYASKHLKWIGVNYKDAVKTGFSFVAAKI